MSLDHKLIRGLAALGVFCLALAARADRIYYQNGKVIEGLVQEEFPTRVKFLFQGRSIVIPRDRIAKIEVESGGNDVASLIARATDALAAGEAEQAKALLQKAVEVDGQNGPHLDELRQLDEKIRKGVTQSGGARGRAQAQELLGQAVQYFDRIQNQKGRELLLQALEADPTFDAAHDEMARYMRNNRPPLSEVTAYFCDQVDPDRIKPDHPVIALLPQVYEEVVRDYRTATTPEGIARNTARLNKISAAFDKNPTWAQGATQAQSGLIAKKSHGIIVDQISADLQGRVYQRAMDRLLAWERADANIEVATLYVRAWIGLGQMEPATQMLETAKGLDPSNSTIEKQINALTLYHAVQAEIANNNHKEARGVLARLYSVKQDLLPEIYDRVVQSKVGYDVSDMQALEPTDPTGAANLAIAIHDYTSDPAMSARAAQTFARVAPLIQYQLKVGWIADGQNVPLHKESAEKLAAALAEKFSLAFKDDSPFVLTLNVHTTSVNNSGAMLVAATTKPDPFGQDYVDPDDRVKGLKLEIQVAHPQAPNLFSSTLTAAGLAPGQTLGAVDKTLGNIFFTINALSAFDVFIQTDMLLYLPPPVATLGAQLKLPAR